MTAVLPLVLPLTAPVVLGGYAPVLSGQGGGVPAGYTRSTIDGVRFTYNGAPVFDNYPSTPLSVRTQ